MKLFAPLAAACLLATAGSALAADPNLGRTLAATCANCHGTNGHAVKGSGMDALAGMEKAKTLQKLADFKSGDKPASIMHQIAKGYTDEQIVALADYFSKQQPQK
jgi:cytochrome c553